MAKFRYCNTKACYMCSKCLFKIAGKSNNYQFYLYYLVTISHINSLDQFNSWKNLWKFWNGLLCRNKSDTFSLINVAVYWQSSDTEACAKKLSQTLANNINNGGTGIGLRIYVWHCGSNIIFSWTSVSKDASTQATSNTNSQCAKKPKQLCSFCD